MIKNKLNRKFRRALALSTLGVLTCSSNIVVNASTINLINLTPADRCKVLKNVWLWECGNGKLKDLNGYWKNFSWKTITQVGNPTDDIFIIAAEYKDDQMQTFENVIFVKKRTSKWGNIDEGIISILPYNATILQNLKKYYNKLGPDYSLPTNERKWWTHTQECIDHLVALSVSDNDKEKPCDKNKTEFEKLCAEYGLTPAEGMAISLTTTALLAGGIIWALNKTIKTVGEAGGNIIHGNTNTNVPQPIILTNPSQTPAPIIINNK